VDHTCNPSYSRVRDQKNQGLQSTQVNNFQDPILKISNTKTGWQNGSRGSVPAYHGGQPQYAKKKKKINAVSHRTLIGN
jgi:hypothetical protein